MCRIDSTLRRNSVRRDPFRSQPVCRQSLRGHHSGRQQSRSGIVLLVVLGMLTLFSVMAVSYLVFTTRQRSTAYNISRSESRNFDGEQLLGDALEEILVGSDSPDSSVWGHDILGDLYGMRDAILGEMTPQASFVVADPLVAPNVLMNDFVRIPTELFRTATYPNRRVDHTSLAERNYPSASTPLFEMDDELAGRVLTFREGPLEGLSMKVLRSFGNHVSTTVTNGRQILSGQLVLDMRPHLHRAITIDSLGETNTLARWLEKALLPTSDVDHQYISRLFYNQPPELVTAATPLSDFYLNGAILNGPGLGFDVGRTSLTVVGDANQNLNEVINTNHSPLPAAAPSPIGGTAYAGSATGTDVPAALQGHFAVYRREASASSATAEQGYLQDLPGGDADEPYDAPDEQNLWLSYFPTNEAFGASAPSFVRPDLLHWLINQQSGTLDSMTVLRLQQILRAVQRSTTRPLPIKNDITAMPAALSNRGAGVLQLDYSDFTGSNNSDLGRPSPVDGWLDFSETDPVILAANIRRLVRSLCGGDSNGDGYPDWDVDNNGDGIPDSVWTDAGLPLTESEDGSLVKPMVAYLIEDLGGRVDVNLAGNLVQARNAVQKSASGVLYRTGIPTGPTVTHTDLPAGFGYGPAEISLNPLFGTSPNGALDLLRRRLVSRTFSGVEYVASGHLIDPITQSGNDLMGVLRQPYLPNVHSTANAYGLPVDKFGRSSMALGIDGGLMVANSSVTVQTPTLSAGAQAGDANDDPYEMITTPGELPDSAFTLPDMEAMLRFNDFDRDALDSALVELAQNHLTTIADRQEFANSVTTISSSASVNTGMLPQEYRGTNLANSSDTPASIFDDAVRSLPPNSGTNRFDTSQRNALLMQLLPREVLSGGKLNLNRPFGNGIDDDGDGVVDDPEELRNAVQNLYFYRDFTGTTSDTFYTTPFSDLTPGEPGPVSAGGVYPEPTPQGWFARHLYVMAMTLVRDLNGTDAFDFSLGVPPTIVTPTFRRDTLPGSAYGTANTAEEEYRAWTLAQWAINVADFRDPDSIMSRFDYDVYPFDGWDISATPLTYRTVWGMEYPELALEESLAMHDRRVRDTNLDAASEPRFSGGTFLDDDTDQWRLPQGSLFLEVRSTRSPDYLRNPATDTDSTSQAWAVPTELYSQVDTSATVGSPQYEYMLDLARTAPDRNPVWRVAISPAHDDAVRGDPRQSGDEMLQPVGSNVDPFAIAMNRQAATLQLDRPDFFGAEIPPPQQVDRVIWFTNVNPDNGLQRDATTNGTTIAGQAYGDFTADDGFIDFAPVDSNSVEKIFYNRFAAADYPYQVTDTDNLTEVHLRGGQYAVIGPRAITHVGSLQSNAGTPTHNPTTHEPVVNYVDYESPQRFLLGSTAFEHRLFTNSNATPTVAGGANSTIRNTVGIIAAANVPTGFTGPPVVGTTPGIGINVSEPLPYPAPVGVNRYYPSPTTRLKADFPFDSYHDFVAATGNLPDVPFDQAAYAELFRVYGPDAERTGTRERFKTAYLQRLADPTQPHDEILNPYISVDYITIDLTVFNGSDGNTQETDAGPPAVTEWTDKGNPDPFGSIPNERFATRYKTGNTIFQGVAASASENLSHSVNTFPPPTTAPETTGAPTLGGHAPYFPFTLNLQTTVNPDTAPPGATKPDSNPGRTAHSSTLGFANASYGDRWRTTGTTDTRYAGMPVNKYFSSATWLNRSYVSPGELMWVPTTSAARFGASFGTATADTGFTAGNVFASQAPPHAVGDRLDYNRVFPHLWNYSSTDQASFVNSPNLHRILNYIEVPAPFDFENDFVSTNRNIENNSTVSTPAQSTFGGSINYSGLGTTVTGNPYSWTNAGATTNAFWLNQMTIESLRAPFNILQPQYRQGRINLNTIKGPRVYRALMEGISDTSDPAFGAFAAEFSQSRRGYLLTGGASEPVMQAGGTITQFDRTRPSQFGGAFRPSNASDLAPLVTDRVRPLDRTIMRPGVTATDALGGDSPLFHKPLGGSLNGEMRQRSALHNDIAITRLNNLAADQSNVFGVWITVGLFKVDGNLHVGQELGSDLGQSRRFQSFHIIDRSVPVMYEPGQLNNAMETVLLSRMLN
ncbi:hypothetical protein [Rubripirellula reticaptiva]|uniref:Uncharacterized protein n=1 Tax=Rubripirellula reticaptiva TaxID=2528013 RepID=A0A5C6EHI2_9BACT|nr:hypothetical protein [Rubripirellula reticaptiva]TWU47944.1 hypothetical protein Poly59_47880 [Rubripirellula reticaptiva]